jgi:hypothetical protein
MRYLAAVVLLFAVGCENGTSPVQPTPSQPVSPQPAPPPVFSLSGSVQDTASRPLRGARVEVIAGDRLGTFETSDNNGRFRMPGTFTGTVTVTASKDGYHSVSSTVPLPQVLRRLSAPLGENFGFWMNLSLQPDGPVANIAGEYTVTITADRSCSALPDEVRTRAYRATIIPTGRPTAFQGTLSDARFIHNSFSIGMAGDFVDFSISILEQLSETIYLLIEGGLSASFGPSGISAPLNAQVVYCPVRPVYTSGEYWACPTDTGVDCSSIRHQLTLAPR